MLSTRLVVGSCCRLLPRTTTTTLKFFAMEASSSSSSSSPPILAAVVQMRCTSDKARNLNRGTELVKEAKRRGADLVFLPEAFDFIGESSEQTRTMAEDMEGPTITAYKELAASEKVVLSLGGFHEKGGDGGSGGKVRNTHVLLGRDGSVVGKYSKAHLFDVDIPGGARLKESDYVEPGGEIGHPVTVGSSSPGGEGVSVGLGVCYDLRFPEFSLALRRRGAQLLTYPSAFTVATGMAHWEVLLRARAVENQCFVAAAAQCGRHNDRRSSYGHSMVVDPWGAVLARCGEGEGVAVAPLDLGRLAEVRRSMPLQLHRRADLYGLAAEGEEGGEGEEGEDPIAFGTSGAVIHRDCLVFSTPLTVCAVNRKPVLPGHLLVLPRRQSAVRGRDMTAAEAADLALSVRRAQAAAEAHFGASASTVAAQDGADAGRTVDHLHVHVLPRREGDFEKNDDVYDKLEKHDKEDSGWRTREAMAKEAAEIRATFESLKT